MMKIGIANNVVLLVKKEEEPNFNRHRKMNIQHGYRVFSTFQLTKNQKPRQLQETRSLKKRKKSAQDK